MIRSIPDTIRAARKVSAPLLAVATLDQFATITAIAKAMEELKNVPPIVQWDCARAFLKVNEPGERAIGAIMPKDQFPGVTPGLNLVEALTMAQALPPKSILVLLNGHRFLNEPGVLQAILNLREPFKKNQRTLVILGPIVRLPLELQQDVMTYDEPLPDEETLRGIVVEQVAQAKAAKEAVIEPDATTVQRAVEALAGLSFFSAEQGTALTLGSAEKLDLVQLWDRKRAFVQQTKGLKFDVDTLTFADLGGVDTIKTFADRVFSGKVPPRAIIRIDEIEKALAGATGPLGDSSGTSQDALGTILSSMEDNEWSGLIAVGPPGSGKSAFSKAIGNSHQIPTLSLDLGAAKGSLVGESEENIRTAMKVIKAIAGPDAYFVATCNKLEIIPPELRRRFVHGIWYFDLPTIDELRSIWTINLRKYGHSLDEEHIASCLALSTHWTGAEVRNVCRLAWASNMTIAEAATFIVPVATSDPDAIDKLRRAAAGKFLSASKPGPYTKPTEAAALASGNRFMES